MATMVEEIIIQSYTSYIYIILNNFYLQRKGYGIHWNEELTCKLLFSLKTIALSISTLLTDVSKRTLQLVWGCKTNYNVQV